MFKSKKRKELENRVAELESKVTAVEATVTVELDSNKVAKNVEKYLIENLGYKPTYRR